MSTSHRFLKNLLTTASSLAVLLGTPTTTLGSARTVTGNATFSTGVGLNGATPFVSGSTLAYNGIGAYAVNADTVTNILALNTAGATAPGIMAINTNVSLGSVVDTSLSGNKLNIFVQGFILSLTGTDSGGVGFVAAANDYTALGNMTLFGANGEVVFNPPGITLGDAVQGNIDNAGLVSFSSSPISSLSINGAGSLGVDNANRLRIVSTDGQNSIDVNVPVYSKLLAVNGTGDVTFNNVVDTGALGSLTLNSTGSTTTFNNNITSPTIQVTPTSPTNPSFAIIGANKALSGSISNISSAAFTLNFAGSGTWSNGANSSFEILKAGAGNVTISTGGTYTIGEIQGNGTSTLTIPNAFALAGAINANGGSAVNLDFQGGGSVTGTIGAGAPVGNINLTTTPGVVTFGNTVIASAINFATTSTLNLNGFITGPIDFNNNAGIINISGGSSELKSAITSTGGVKGTLNFAGVNSVVHGAIDGISTIQVNTGITGAEIRNKIGNSVPVTQLILSNNSSLTLADAHSAKFSNAASSAIVLGNNAELTVVSDTTLTGTNGTESIDGAVANQGTFSIAANTTLQGLAIGANQRINSLYLSGGGGPNFVVTTDKSINANNIIIESSVVALAGPFGTKYFYFPNTLQVNGNGNISVTGATQFTNVNNNNSDSAPTSYLIFDSTNGASTFTIHNNISSNQDNEGILKLQANGNALTLSGAAAETIGASNVLRLRGLETSGASATNVNTKVYVKNLNLNGTGLVTFNNIVDLGASSSLTFGAAGSATFNNGATMTKLDFANKAATVNIANGQTLTGSATSTGGQNGSIVFAGTGTWTGGTTGVGIKTLKVGAGNVALSGSAYTINEIQGNGTNTLTLPNNFTLTGAINSSGGQAVDLTFQGGGAVTGTIGAGASVGNILLTTNAGTVNFGSDVTAAKIDIQKAGSTAKLGGSLTGNVVFTSAGTLEVSGNNGVIDGTIDGTGGAIIVDNSVTGVVFNGAIGGTTAVASLTLGTNAEATLATVANDTKFDNGGNTAISLGSGSVLTVTNGGPRIFTGNNDSIDGVAIDQGTLAFKGVGIAFLTDLEIGRTNALHSLALRAASVYYNKSINVTDISIGDIGTPSDLMFSNSTTAPVSLTGAVTFGHPDSNFGLFSVNGGGDANFTINNPIGTVDNKGVVFLNINTGALNLNGVGSIGTDNTHRVQKFRAVITGFSATSNVNVYAKNITIENTFPLIFNKTVDSGIGGSLTFSAAGDVTFNDIANIETIDFNNNAGNINIGIGATLTNNLIEDSSGNNKGTLTFLDGGILGDIGSAGKGINSINIAKVGGGGVVDVQGTNIYVQSITFTQANNTLKSQSNISAPVIFTKAGTVEIYGVGPVIVTTAFSGGAIGASTFNANTNVKVTDGVVLGIGTVNVADTKTLTIQPSGNISINATNLNLLGASSGLGLDTTTADSIFSLNNSILGAGDNKGIVSLNANGHILTVTPTVAQTLGSSNSNRLQQFNISGSSTTTINAKVFAKSINVKSTGTSIFGTTIDSGVGSNLNFSSAGNIVFNEDTKIEAIDFNNNAGSVTVASGKTITSNVTSTGGQNGSLIFAGSGIWAGSTTGVGFSMLKAGAGNVTISTGGTYTIEEIQGNGTNTLTLPNNFALIGAINSTGGSSLNLEFQAGGSVSGTVGAKTALHNIDITGLGRTVTFAKAVNITGNVTLADTATVQFADNVTAQEIAGKNSDQGTIEFVNNAAITVTSNIGGQPAKMVKITDASVTVTGSFAADEIAFTNPAQVAALKILGSSDLANATVTTTSTFRQHNIHVSTDQHITGNWGSNTNLMGGIKLRGDNYLKIDTLGFYAGVNIVTDNTGTVEFVKDGSFAYEIGRFDGNSVKEVIFSANASSFGVIKAQTITVADGKTATFGSGVTIEDATPNVIRPHIMSTNGMTLGRGSKAILADDALLEGAIFARGTGVGSVNFLGDAVIRREMGTSLAKLDNVTFVSDTGDKVIRLQKDIHANTIITNDSTVHLIRSIHLDGTLTANSTNFDLGSHILTLPSGISVFKGDISIATTFDNTKSEGGHITIDGEGSELDFSGANSVKVTVTANSLDINSTENYTLFLKAHNGKVIQNDNVQVESNDSNRFVVWNYDFKTRKLYKGPRPSAVTNDLKNTNGNTDDFALAEFFDTETGGDIATIRNNFSGMTNTQVLQAIKKLQPTVETSPGNILEDKRNVDGVVDNRANDVSNLSTITVTDNGGVAAGDTVKDYGPWFSPFYDRANQRLRNFKSGYRSKSYGGTLGVDTMLSDNLMLGAAVSALVTDTKHQDAKAGDKGKINSQILSIYGLHNLNNNWFVQGNGSIGFSQVKNSEQRIISSTLRLQANSKYKVTAYSMQLLAGHDYRLTRSFVATPMFGLRYDRFSDISYQETGASIQNMSVKRQASNRLEAIVGGKIVFAKAFMGFELVPELHSFINYNFIGKSPKLDVRLSGVTRSLPIRAVKPSKLSYNVGGGLNAKRGIMEYGATYEVQIDSKYISHQGMIKLRVNF